MSVPVPCRIGSLPLDGLGSLAFDHGFPEEGAVKLIPGHIGVDADWSSLLSDQYAVIQRCGFGPVAWGSLAEFYNSDGSIRIFRRYIQSWVVTPDPATNTDYFEDVISDDTMKVYAMEIAESGTTGVIHGSGTWPDLTGYDSTDSWVITTDTESELIYDHETVYTRSGYQTYTISQRQRYLLPRFISDCLDDAWDLYQAMSYLHAGTGYQIATFK
jgi:hypothetical protein